ncbi:MAG: gp436 family protein [Acidovorax sp.]|uniref:gp436 family protein n=1 Tax=Acidovorax sp. TaxID=1872122 RepID=UPI00391CF040
MRYCTQADLLLSIPRQTVVWLSNEDSQAVDINEAVVEDAVRQAEELADAHLRGRYTLPLDPVPTVIKDIVVQLARHALYARRPEGSGLPEAVVQTYKASLRLLESIRDGKLTIGDPVTSTPQREPGAYKVRAPRRRGGLPDSSTWGVV